MNIFFLVSFQAIVVEIPAAFELSRFCLCVEKLLRHDCELQERIF